MPTSSPLEVERVLAPPAIDVPATECVPAEWSERGCRLAEPCRRVGARSPAPCFEPYRIAVENGGWLSAADFATLLAGLAEGISGSTARRIHQPQLANARGEAGVSPLADEGLLRPKRCDGLLRGSNLALRFGQGCAGGLVGDACCRRAL